ncbi:hypothetical protein [Luteolibacter sp. LG18]|uniref:hypothetical protein n=1 Tax=Luteolibacter sp. LG18 TaxID=2819286 RepID=UPI002B2C86A3|nr:hypothetical protein llg_27430 [Luteolibacter sp. LG18]
MKALVTPLLALGLAIGTAGAQQVSANVALGSSGRGSVVQNTLGQTGEAQPGIHGRSLLFLIESLPEKVFAYDAAVANSDKPLPGMPVHAKGYLNHEFDNLPMGAKEIVFTKSEDPASVKAADQRIARAVVPENLKSGIFLFLPGTGKPGDDLARVMVLDDSAQKFPAGSLKVMNLSPQPIRIQLENKDFDFKIGEQRNIENPPVNENQMSGMRAFGFQDNQWQRIGASMWPHPGTKRVLQIIFMNPATQQVEIRGVRDVTSL